MPSCSNYTLLSALLAPPLTRSLGKATEPRSMRREEVELAWGAKAGASTALVGLEKGLEAYAEAAKSLEFANQVGAKLLFIFYSSF